MKKFLNVVLVFIVWWVVAVWGILPSSGPGGLVSSPDAPSPSSGEEFPLTVIDDLDRSVTIPTCPERIISLAPSNTEILFELGLGDRVIGDTVYCDYPEEAKGKEKVGGYSDIDIEKVIALNPDLILAEDIHKAEVIPALERLGYPVVAIVPHNLEEIMSSVEFIGKITGSQEQASEIVQEMHLRINAISEKTSLLSWDERPKVLYVLWWGEGGIMSVGSNTPIDELIYLAGGRSISHYDSSGNPTIGWPTLGLEDVIYANPDVILADLGDGGISLQNILSDPRLSGIGAVAGGRVYGIDPNFTNRPTPRIVKGLEQLAGLISPQLFPDFYSLYVTAGT